MDETFYSDHASYKALSFTEVKIEYRHIYTITITT